MTVAGVLLLALVDSINPSAIVVTLYLLSTAGSRALANVLVYVSAIFATYLTLGVVMVLGIGAFLTSVGDMLDRWPGFVAQAIVGLALLIYSVCAATKRETPPVVRRPSASSSAALVMLGIGVTAMELPTAIPYLAATALISEAQLPARTWLPLLATYNVIFVLPPLALLVGHLVLQERMAGPYAALRQRVESGAHTTMVWLAGLVGGALFATGVIELVARLR